jgi:hypothetical protein
MQMVAKRCRTEIVVNVIAQPLILNFDGVNDRSRIDKMNPFRFCTSTFSMEGFWIDFFL